MVVLALIAIMVVMILPEMKGTLEDERLRAASRQLIRACHLASSQSVTLGKTHRVRLLIEEDQFQVERWSPASHGGSGFQPVPNLPDSQGKIHAHIQAEVRPLSGGGFLIPDPEIPTDEGAPQDPKSDRLAIQFFPDGRAEPREIQLRDRQGFSLTILVNPINGRVQTDQPTRRP